MYQALYRKYRPKNFAEVVSQEAIVNTLQNSIMSHHVGHAYLFSGPRGTGKTTVAKIFARTINCLEPVDGKTCEKCENCLYSIQKECMDIIEIDAASNNGIDEIRDLRSKVNILPTQLPYKVYIIDEVHMLSIGAFNALLKTLEEPPKHIVFILATTDPQKIPQTIISRCQCYQFKKISDANIIPRLKEITTNEKIVLEEEVYSLIARASDGGLRDAIGLLDKLGSCYQRQITVEDFFEINGEIGLDEVAKFSKILFEHNAREILVHLNQYYENGKDLVQVLKQMQFYLKEHLVDYYLGKGSLNYPEQELIDFINLLNNKMLELKKADDIKMYIEIMLLHFVNTKTNSSKIISREIISQENIPEKKAEFSNQPAEKDSNETNLQIEKQKELKETDYTKIKEIMSIRSRNTLATAIKSELIQELDNWKKIEDFTFDETVGYLACELLDGKPKAASEETVIISYEYESMIEKISQHVQKLIDFYQKITKSSKNLAFICEDDWNKLRNEYIQLLKSGKHFTIEKEPILEEKDSNNKNKASSTNVGEQNQIEQTIELFGDIVEVK